MVELEDGTRHSRIGTERQGPDRGRDWTAAGTGLGVGRGSHSTIPIYKELCVDRAAPGPPL